MEKLYTSRAFGLFEAFATQSSTVSGWRSWGASAT